MDATTARWRCPPTLYDYRAAERQNLLRRSMSSPANLVPTIVVALTEARSTVDLTLMLAAVT
jgi:hypothetical protein